MVGLQWIGIGNVEAYCQRFLGAENLQANSIHRRSYVFTVEAFSPLIIVWWFDAVQIGITES